MDSDYKQKLVENNMRTERAEKHLDYMLGSLKACALYDNLNMNEYYFRSKINGVTWTIVLNKTSEL